MNTPPIIFDRKLKRIHRAASVKTFDNVSYLHDFATQILTDRLNEDISLSFDSVLELGARNDSLVNSLTPKPSTIIRSDSITETSPDLLCDEELIPFAANSFDLIISNLNLHWVNDLPGTLIQINRCLKEKGLFVATMFGGNSLHELGSSLHRAELEVTNGASPRVSPFIEMKDAGMLLQRAGYQLPVSDNEIATVKYTSMLNLMHDLRAMGEANSLMKRSNNLKRNVLEKASEIYANEFSSEPNSIDATFDIICLTGWKS